MDTVPLSYGRISKRIDEMFSDTQSRTQEKKSDGCLFSLQLDELTDRSKKCQLLNNLRLERIFELRKELLRVFNVEKPNFKAHLIGEVWYATLTYVAEIIFAIWIT